MQNREPNNERPTRGRGAPGHRRVPVRCGRCGAVGVNRRTCTGERATHQRLRSPASPRRRPFGYGRAQDRAGYVPPRRERLAEAIDDATQDGRAITPPTEGSNPRSIDEALSLLFNDEGALHPGGEGVTLASVDTTPTSALSAERTTIGHTVRIEVFTPYPRLTLGALVEFVGSDAVTGLLISDEICDAYRA